MRAISDKLGALALAAALLGCNSSPSADLPSRDAPPLPQRPAPAASAASTGVPSSSAAAPSATGPTLAEMASGVVAGEEPAPLAGVWEGRYEAKKGTVTLPPKVKDKGIAADQGKVAVGPGSVELTVLANGEIRGKVSGALGAGSISGKVDGGTLRAMVSPDDPFAPNAMTGILMGERKGDTVACEMHLAGPDATVIREAKVELTKK